MTTRYLQFLPLVFPALIISCNSGESAISNNLKQLPSKEESAVVKEQLKPAIDTALFLKLNKKLANGDTTGKWPAKMPIPLPGAILPFHRIVAFYGNLYSTKMGILGELPKDQMIKKLLGEAQSWQRADTTLKVIPALHYIAVTAQASPGPGNKHRLRMPFSQIDKIISWSHEIKGLTFLDIQVGQSTVQEEVPVLDSFLKMPTVHLGIDPEFSMKGGHVPGKKIGTFDAADINWVIEHLASLVRKNNLPPKILVLHRFTQGMLTNYQNIKKVPEVQIVVDMDGWGPKHLKRSTWLRYIYREPVEFTGFKLFYKNDTKTGADQFYTPKELLKFIPQPVYIQYQ
ncbi:MAG: hypothetical protein J0H55_15500 [Chitinophagaceae bacterium]|nr:hypothetical protein [Chitinophagaceae bacterium]